MLSNNFILKRKCKNFTIILMKTIDKNGRIW